jgi:hypothetical protein
MNSCVYFVITVDENGLRGTVRRGGIADREGASGRRLALDPLRPEHP